MKTTLWISICNREYGDPLKEPYPKYWRIDREHSEELNPRGNLARHSIPANGDEHLQAKELNQWFREGQYPVPVCLWLRIRPMLPRE